jgi:hypothetical protein
MVRLKLVSEKGDPAGYGYSAWVFGSLAVRTSSSVVCRSFPPHLGVWMNNPMGGYPTSANQTSANQQEPPSTSEIAKDEAAEVARSAKHSGGQVAGTVGEQANRVASETAQQARNLFEEGKGQLADQAREGQRKAADGLRALADQLHGMSEKSDGEGIVPEVARQASERARTAASWLAEREPGDLLAEVRRFARRRPGVFLAGAALAGVVAGRLTRGAIAAQSESSSPADTTPPSPAPAPPPAQAVNPALDVPGPERTVTPAPGYSMPPAQPAWSPQSDSSAHQAGPVTR